MLQEHVALLNTPYDDNYSVQQPRGYAPMVIYNDYCSGQEEVGCKGRGHLRGSHAVSVLVVAFGNCLFSRFLPLIASLLERRGS